MISNIVVFQTLLQNQKKKNGFYSFYYFYYFYELIQQLVNQTYPKEGICLYKN